MALKKRLESTSDGKQGYLQSRTGNNHYLMGRKHFIESNDGEMLDEIIPLSTAIYSNKSFRGHPLHFLNSNLFSFLASEKNSQARKDIIHPFLTTRMEYRNYSPFTVSIVNSKTSRVVDSLSVTLLIPPRSMQISTNHEITTTMTTMGPMTIAHIPDPISISVSGKSAAFITSMDGLANYRSRRISAGFLNLHALTALFRSNGAARMSYKDLFGDEAGSANNIPGSGDMISPIISIVDQVKITYDGTSYLGHFTTFSFSESAQTPYNFDFQFEFISTGLEGDAVEGHVDHAFTDLPRIAINQADAQLINGVVNPGQGGNFFESDIMGFTPQPTLLDEYGENSDGPDGSGAIDDSAHPMRRYTNGSLIPTPTMDKVVYMAHQFATTNPRYLSGGAGAPGAPVDCSGMVWGCIPQLGAAKMRAQTFMNESSTITRFSYDKPQVLLPGDIIMWGNNPKTNKSTIHHSGIITATYTQQEIQAYIDGGGSVIERWDSGKGKKVKDWMRMQIKELVSSGGDPTKPDSRHGPRANSYGLGGEGIKDQWDKPNYNNAAYWMGTDKHFLAYSRATDFARLLPIQDFEIPTKS